MEAAKVALTRVCVDRTGQPRAGGGWGVHQWAWCGMWVGKTTLGNKNISFLAETLSKLRFLWSFHFLSQTIRWRVGPMWEVRRVRIGWEKFSIVFALIVYIYISNLGQTIFKVIIVITVI
jgi:hypothetical protein